MVFASLTFLCFFLPINVLLYYLSGNKVYRNVLLTIFSLVFYAWGEPVWVVLLIFSACIDYLNGLWIAHYRGTAKAKWGVISSIVINVSLLVIFKYSAFLYENLNYLLGLQLSVPTFTLPIGISFYTFQTISYTIDVYKGEVQAQKSLGKFLMFVSLYHQLVAGPIVRYAHIAHEIDHRKVAWQDIGEGIHRFCIGLFKKVCIANVAGELAMTYLEGDLSSLSVGEAWFGILMFSIQIYFDFSGYSDMAIGLGKMFGFHYHENFNYPYIARSATDFWRRWHISLGTFFRDYVYIPLGGNKKRGLLNLIIVWFLTGLWHGASWNFIFWGLYFGLLILLERIFLLSLLKRLPVFVGHIYLLLAVVFGWALFYFTDFERLNYFLSIMVGLSGNPLWNFELSLVLQENVFWLVMSILLCMPVYLWLMERAEKYTAFSLAFSLQLFRLIFQWVLLLLSITMLVGNSYNPFIYYRF